MGLGARDRLGDGHFLFELPAIGRRPLLLVIGTLYALSEENDTK